MTHRSRSPLNMSTKNLQRKRKALKKALLLKEVEMLEARLDKMNNPPAKSSSKSRSSSSSSSSTSTSASSSSNSASVKSVHRAKPATRPTAVHKQKSTADTTERVVIVARGW